MRTADKIGLAIMISILSPVVVMLWAIAIIMLKEAL